MKKFQDILNEQHVNEALEDTLKAAGEGIKTGVKTGVAALAAGIGAKISGPLTGVVAAGINAFREKQKELKGEFKKQLPRNVDSLIDKAIDEAWKIKVEVTNNPAFRGSGKEQIKNRFVNNKLSLLLKQPYYTKQLKNEPDMILDLKQLFLKSAAMYVIDLNETDDVKIKSEIKKGLGL